jgi:hypothetical protein
LIVQVGEPRHGAFAEQDAALHRFFESLSDLTCTIDLDEFQKRAGGGAACSFNPRP